MSSDITTFAMFFINPSIYLKIIFHTLGCKLNFAESSSIANSFRASGHEVADKVEDAEVVVVNSCAVTDSAEKKCRAAIRQLHRKNPNALLVVMGCFSQLDPDILISMEEVDLVVGNEQKNDLQAIIAKYMADDSKKNIFNTPIAKTCSFVPGYSLIDRTRTFLKIQDGCNYFCSYCTIPYARGRSRSNSIAETAALIEDLNRREIGEIVLTGVNIGDFGKPAGESFLQLLQKLASMNIRSRIRIGSVEPNLLSNDIISLVANTPFLMPHFHIPLQAGTDGVLKRMKRSYNTALFAERVMEIKDKIPDAFIACDVIAGFPGETDKDFNNGYGFISSLPISALHAFTFSERKNTPAASMESKIPVAVRRERTHALRELSDQKKSFFYNQNLGQQREVLFESGRQKNQILGFSDNYIRVRHSWNIHLVNKRVKVMLESSDGELVKVSLPEENLSLLND